VTLLYMLIDRCTLGPTLACCTSTPTCMHYPGIGIPAAGVICQSSVICGSSWGTVLSGGMTRYAIPPFDPFLAQGAPYVHTGAIVAPPNASKPTPNLSYPWASAANTRFTRWRYLMHQRGDPLRPSGMSNPAPGYGHPRAEIRP
jgi:hypothetical protein